MNDTTSGNAIEDTTIGMLYKHTCSTCPYGEFNNDGHGNGIICKRTPPGVMAGGGLFTTRDWAFPFMRAKDWCWEHPERQKALTR